MGEGRKKISILVCYPITRLDVTTLTWGVHETLGIVCKGICPRVCRRIRDTSFMPVWVPKEDGGISKSRRFFLIKDLKWYLQYLWTHMTTLGDRKLSTSCESSHRLNILSSHWGGSTRLSLALRDSFSHHPPSNHIKTLASMNTVLPILIYILT